MIPLCGGGHGPACRLCFNAAAATQLVVTADGIGDHVRALAVAAAWRKRNPGVRLHFVAKPWCVPWVSLFDAYDVLEVRATKRFPAAWTANNGALHFVECCARAESIPPAVRPLPADALAWAEQYRGAVILCPYSLSPNGERDWLLSHWLRLERDLRCVVIGGAGADLSMFRSPTFTGLPATSVAALMRAASRVVSNESGMAHVAGALSAPCIVLAAQLDAPAIYRVWRSVRVIEGPMSCRHCRWTGPEFRPRCHQLCACLQAILPETVLAALDSLPHVQYHPLQHGNH